MNREQFHIQLKNYLRLSNRSQKELAKAISLHPNVLTHKLKGAANYTLTYQNIRDIILILARWESFTTKPQILELIGLVDLGETFFTPQQWQAPPLNA